MASLTEAEKAWKQGEKLSKKTVFHKPKWREAGDAFDKASMIYTRYNNPLRSAEASIEAGRCYSTGDMPLAGADKYERAANMLCPRGKPCLNTKLASEAYCKAGMCYAMGGNQKRCSQMLIECAKCLKNESPDEAIDKLKDAIEIFISEDRAVYTVDVFELMLSIQLENIGNGKETAPNCTKCGIPAAIETLKTMEGIFEQLRQPHNIRRAVLAEICLLCYQGNVGMAEEMALSVPDMRELESEAGLAIVDAAKEEDEVLWKKALRHNGMMSMWTSVFKVLGTCHFDDSQKKKKSQVHATTNGMTFSTGGQNMESQPATGTRFSAGMADIDSEEDEDEDGGVDDSYSL